MAAYPGETPRPEQKRGPEARLFNVDALSDDELIFFYRNVKAAADAAAGEGLFEKPT
jgi:hypothetical protein